MKRILSGVCAVMMLAAGAARGATAYLRANDAVGSSSFTTSGNWSDGMAPQAGNDHSTQGYLLRTPAAGWDFVDSWDMVNLQRYPLLRAFSGNVNPADINFSGRVDLEDLAVVAENWLAD